MEFGAFVESGGNPNIPAFWTWTNIQPTDKLPVNREQPGAADCRNGDPVQVTWAKVQGRRAAIFIGWGIRAVSNKMQPGPITVDDYRL